MSPLKYSIRYCVFLRDILIDAKVNYFTMIIVVMYWWQKKKKKEKKTICFIDILNLWDICILLKYLFREKIAILREYLHI